MKLKKLFLLSLAAFLCVMSLSSCRKSPENIYALVVKLSESFGEESGACVFYSDTEKDGFTVADGETLGRLYVGKWEAPPCFSRIRGYAVRIPLDDSGFEIHALKCVNVSDTEEVSRLVQKRIDRLQNAEIKAFAPESYERYFVGAEIYVRGDTVFLLATPDNRAVKKMICR